MSSIIKKTLFQVQFAIESPLLDVPADIVKALLDKYIIWNNVSEELYCIKCDQKLSFSFQFEDGQVYTLNEKNLIISQQGKSDKYCLALFSKLTPARYTSAPDWRLGSMFGNHYCQAFDFGKNLMGIAEYKSNSVK